MDAPQKLPAGTCELCGDEASYADSIPDANVPGPHHQGVPGYRPQRLCMIHAVERRKVATSRVRPILWCESENCFRYDFDRAAADCICNECKREYRRHPKSVDYQFLNVLCDGSLVKL